MHTTYPNINRPTTISQNKFTKAPNAKTNCRMCVERERGEGGEGGEGGGGGEGGEGGGGRGGGRREREMIKREGREGEREGRK